jgi:hypothetical protein
MFSALCGMRSGRPLIRAQTRQREAIQGVEVARRVGVRGIILCFSGSLSSTVEGVQMPLAVHVMRLTSSEPISQNAVHFVND